MKIIIDILLMILAFVVLDLFVMSRSILRALYKKIVHKHNKGDE